MLNDTIDKIVGSYFRVVTTEPLFYKGARFDPEPLRVSEGIFRGYTCPSGCGGCCMRFSLDYLPSEKLPAGWEARFTEREIEVNGKKIIVLSDIQEDFVSDKCIHLRRHDGRCNVHGRQPFSCDFELIRISISQEEEGTERNNAMSTRLFGRGWSFTRVDGEKGALCTITEVSKESIADTIRKLERLKAWCDHFQISTVMEDILEWARTGPHVEPLYLNQKFKVKKRKSMTLPIFRRA